MRFIYLYMMITLAFALSDAVQLLEREVADDVIYLVMTLSLKRHSLYCDCAIYSRRILLP